MALELKEWVGLVFDGPGAPSADRLIELQGFCGPDVATLQRLSEVFEGGATLLAPYRDESIDQALWDLSYDVFDALTDHHIDWSVRRRFIDSFEPLYRKLYAARCQPVLGHRSEAGSALNSSCYMWWDLLWYHERDLWTDELCLESMRAILAIDHVACQEGALHGLGHWHRGHSAEVEGIIDEYLQRNACLREELRQYAVRARTARAVKCEEFHFALGGLATVSACGFSAASQNGPGFWIF